MQKKLCKKPNETVRQSPSDEKRAAASSTYPAGTLNTVAPGASLTIPKNGYLYVWVSNETQGWDVFFDNLSVQHKQGPLLEENHYYPYGLSMEGLSDKAIKTNYAENKLRYNSGSELQNKEFSDGSGWEMYETQYRGYDPQIGRFGEIDPLADISHFSSTYEYAGNNPVLMDDPTGLFRHYEQDPTLSSTAINNMNPGFGSPSIDEINSITGITVIGARMKECQALMQHFGMKLFPGENR
jgi:RHS repeat-associated protein